MGSWNSFLNKSYLDQSVSLQQGQKSVFVKSVTVTNIQPIKVIHAIRKVFYLITFEDTLGVKYYYRYGKDAAVVDVNSTPFVVDMSYDIKATIKQINKDKITITRVRIVKKNSYG